MKFSIQAYIKTDNDGRRNAVEQVLPSADDSRIWNTEYDLADTVDEDGKVLVANISFNIESDRNGVYKSMKGIEGIIQSCEFDSFVRTYKSWHDEAVDGVPPFPCEQEEILRRT